MPVIDEKKYTAYFSALLSGKGLFCADIIAQLMEKKTPVIDIYTDIFQRSLYEVGELWEHNRISVAAEHLTSAQTQALMNLMYPDIISPDRTGRKIIITAVEKEEHQIGAKMVSDVFEMHGWDAFFLGANTPTGELIRYAGEIRPQALGLSLTVWFHMEYLENMIRNIRKELPEIRILIGGQAFRHGLPRQLNRYPDIVFIESLDRLDKMIEKGNI